MRAILATSRSSFEDPMVVNMAEEMRAVLTIVTVEPPAKDDGLLSKIHPRLGKQSAYLRLLQNTVAQCQTSTPIHYVFIPFLDDYCLFSTAFHQKPFGEIPWGGIVIRPRFHLKHVGVVLPFRVEDVFETFTYKQLLRNNTLDRVFSIDPYLKEHLRSERIVTVPDPAEMHEPDHAVPDFRIAAELVVLLVYGYIDHRKAIDRLVRALLDERVPLQLTLLLVGAQSADTAKLIRGAEGRRLHQQGRLIEVNRFVSDGEEAAAFQRADIIWAYYPKSYCSSGAMVRAGQASRPVIATREGLVGHTVSRLGMGLTAPENDDNELTLVLARLATEAATREKLGKSGFEHFSQYTAEAFGDLIVAQMDKAILSGKDDDD